MKPIPQGDRVIKLFVDEFRFVTKHFLRVFIAPFVGAVREMLKEGRYFEAELLARWRARESSHSTGHNV